MIAYYTTIMSFDDVLGGREWRTLPFVVKPPTRLVKGVEAEIDINPMLPNKAKSKEVMDAKIKEFIDLLNDCEFARYAPADDAKEMDNVYSRTMALITEMEQMIKK